MTTYDELLQPRKGCCAMDRPIHDSTPCLVGAQEYYYSRRLGENFAAGMPSNDKKSPGPKLYSNLKTDPWK